MRDELHLMELVDRYLDGSMSGEERTAFEVRANGNVELRQLIADQRVLREGVARAPVRAAAAKAYRAYRFGKAMPWAGGALIVAIVAVATLSLWRSQVSGSSTENTNEQEPMLERFLDDTIGSHLNPLVMTIDPKEDTTLLTPSGIVLDIPYGAFMDDHGNTITTAVRVTMLEALEPLDIMKAGLSTMSGDTLLETGGMFYFDAQANGKAVRIDPARPIVAMVPAKPGQADMQLYQGVKLEDGTIDWRNPRPLKKSLVPVDITTLNFYPPGYEAKLAALGQDVMDKVFMDSLYYSFSGDMFAQITGPGKSRWISIEEVERSFADTTVASSRTGYTAIEPHMGIDPSKVRAIWNAGFNNTNLATREFEERMRAIHGTCDNAVLDLYVNNLDQDLGAIDALSARMGHPEFNVLAERKDGRVDLPAGSADRLARTYREWSRAAAEAVRKTQEAFWSEQQRLDDVGQLRQNKQAQQRLEQDLVRFEREYTANLAEACRQLGIKKLGPTREPPILVYEVLIPNAGWWNLDRALYVMTADRKTGSWSDERTGKVATIQYAPFTVEVVERKSYEDVMVYLVPKEISSYQRMKDGGHRFSESTNKAFTYDVVCLGRRGTERFGALRSVAPSSLEERLALEPMDDSRLEDLLARQDASVSKGLAEESRYAVWLGLDRDRQAKTTALAVLRNQLLPVVFPCSTPEGETADRRAAVLDRTARYPAGEDALDELLTVSLRNADDPLTRYIEGRVEVQFWVLEDGTVHDPKLSRLLYPSCDKRALEIFRTMPKWDPAIRSGKPQRLQYFREVKFVKMRPGTTVETMIQLK